MTDRLMRPRVNLNGTAREALVEQRITVIHRLEGVVEALCQMAPHGRDYIGEDRLFQRDRAIHFERLNAVHEMIHQVTVEGTQINEGTP